MIRLMQAQDIDQVVRIEQQVQFHPWTKTQFADSMLNYQVTVLEKDKQVIGFCIMQPVLDEANLLLMAVDPQYQGQGYGLAILEDAIARLGEKCIQIFLEVRESNLAAIALYEKAGFHQIDLRKNYYPAPHGKKEHAIIMANLLNTDTFNFKLD
ncbi:ribosomal protein S18-alanine N-acetyltransferase [Acinetobacter populi]|uniref:[Ribosomal protein bS18]-alanine N-acetyltransferase n=1 Tax=Acinetobacter populi TaxID=1582270 RepID=A0A1Z9YZY1_9GAMM|nr:ribosomal protein S18-alanine N-acetyltransferase [Acinetobacter populi]OUY07732.1 ribosomal-protein-alanine N-acetyltransferase [Acinetobacter populi]